MISAREKFNALVLTAPLNRADAIVVLCGEDADARAAVAVGLLQQGCASQIILSGGLDDAGKKSAKTVAAALIGGGVSPSRITEESSSKNTREQAENVIALAKEKGWKQLLLVASSYHIGRALLTFIKALDGADIRIVPVTANQSKWTERPEGVKQTRFRLMENEYAKVEQYSSHVASYSEGISYLCGWESK